MKQLFLLVLFALSGAPCQEITQELEQRFQEAFCEARCLAQNNGSTCEDLKCDCSTETAVRNLAILNRTKTQPLAVPTLLCKDENILSFKWEVQNPLIYLTEIRTNASHWSYVNNTSCDRMAIKHLTPNTSYQMRLWAVSSVGDLYGPVSSAWVETYPKDHQLHPVDSFNLTTLFRVEDTYTATMEWNSRDPACFYSMVHFVNDDDFDFVPYDIRNIKDLFKVNITNLKLGTDYFISIEAISADMKRQGEKTWKNLTTPTCLEIYNDLNLCVPPMPEDVQAKEEVYGQTYDLEVSWLRPKLIPDHYTVEVLLKNASTHHQNVSGNETRVKFYKLPLLGDYYVVIIAWSKAGSSEQVAVFKELNITNVLSAISSASWSNSAQISVFGSVGVVLVLVLIICVLLYRRRKHNKTARETKGYDEDFKEKSLPSLNLTTEYYIPELIEDEWHLNPEQVILDDDPLGEGAFGVVHKGLMKCSDGTKVKVAVKMLKGNPSMEEIRQFEHEIEIMKSVGSHPHLVSLLGCCSKMGYTGPFLVVEYCAKGNLQDYLQAVWVQISGQTLDLRYKNTQNISSNHFSNKIYELFDDTLLEPRDLLSFARQIAMGMEYLSSLRVVHRDLATRNVLVCENRIVKVADFGLSRDVYQDNIYTKLGGGKLPVKWMALESLSHQQYTTQSDVWSFGILLWEIVTLGGNPYSTISPWDLMGLLKSGYRMECPKNCSEKLYHIMRICWSEIPKDRPTFTDLQEMLEKLLENENRYISLDVRY